MVLTMGDPADRAVRVSVVLGVESVLVFRPESVLVFS